ncbi:MAG: hypothetical protein JXB04_02445, partial [Kiritimatiellae bacterium]|nr:hypothetical protein [Kiritimatiellia bacterium]
GILSALLLPALHAARLRAYDADCGSNLRQFGAALYQYATSHDDLFPKADGYDKDTSYFGSQYNLIAAISEYIPTNSHVWFCKRFLMEAGREEGLKPREVIADRLSSGWIGYFYWAWDIAGGSSQPYEISTTSSSNIWFTQNWQTNIPGIVLMSCRFRDKAAWSYPEDWQFHAGASVELPLTEPGTFVLISGGSALKIAPAHQ